MAQKTSVTAYAADTFGIVPGVLYTRAGFMRCGGISKNRMTAARHKGVEPKWLMVGKRCYLRGVDAIHYLEQLANLEAK